MADHALLTEAEWKMTLRLWERSPQTVMGPTRSPEPETGRTGHTVMTMLKRMRQKGTVPICEDGPVKTYSPAVDKNRVAREQTRTLPARLFSGWASLLVSCMVEQGEPDEDELRELRGIVERAADRSGLENRQKNWGRGEPTALFARLMNDGSFQADERRPVTQHREGRECEACRFSTTCWKPRFLAAG